MTCTCSKCNAEIAFDVATIPVDGSFTKCSACNSNLEIRKESFAKRALYKSTEISCAECGNPPGTSIYCENCHAVYPEILVIKTSSAAKKQIGKLLASLDILKNIKLKAPVKSHKESFSPSPLPGKGKAAKRPGSNARMVVILVLVFLVASLAGGYFWHQDKIATEYSQNYVRTLLAIKTARDFEINVSNRIVTNMKTGMTATLTAAELKSVTSGMKTIDTLMQSLGKVPAKYSANHEAINKLSVSFGKLHASVTTTSGSSDIYAGSVKKLDDELMQNARDLKSGLPKKISETLAASSKKYKALQDF